MPRWLGKLRRYLPSRRKRVWRYVSPRRRGLGLVGLALLLLLGYLYWHNTNDARVQRQAAKYLAQLTGGEVRIGRAHFSIFGGIKLENLRLYLRDQQEVPFFEAPQVILHHRPGSLLRGRLEPTEILCLRPHVCLVEDVRTQKLNVQRIFPLMGQDSGWTNKLAKLPTIRLREGQLELLDMEEGQLLPVAKSPLPLMVTLLPAEGRGYQLTIESGPGQISGSGIIDTQTGQANLSGLFGLEGLDKALPRKYRLWRQRYNLSGQVSFSGQARLIGSATMPGQLERLGASLIDVAMQLPEEEGRLKFSKVRGQVAFVGSHLEIEKLTGRLEQGGGNFVITGRYEGLAPDSPFACHIELTDLELPLKELPGGALGRMLEPAQRQLELAGKLDLKADVSRDQQGHLSYKLLAELKGMSLRAPSCPLMVTDVSGRVLLEDGRLEFQQVTGRCRGSEVQINGRLAGLGETAACELTVSAKDMAIDKELHDAMPPKAQRDWDLFAPSGRANLVVQIRREEGQPSQTSALIELSGQASAEYRDFPYRLEGLSGKVEVTQHGTFLRNVHGRSGKMGCTINGTIHAGDFRIEVDATDVALDEKLCRALPASARPPLLACGAEGLADVAKGVISRTKYGPVEWSIPTALKNLRIHHQWLPYALNDAAGSLLITHRGLSIQHLAGRHGRSRITATGGVTWGSGPTALELKIDAAELNLDEELRACLPKEAAQAWELVNPAGLADVFLSIATGGREAAGATQPAAGAPARPRYRLIVQPRDMSAKYKHFPYPVSGLSGVVQIEPGVVSVRKLSGKVGSAELAMEGVIDCSDGLRGACLKLRTGPVEIDKQLLAVLPQGLVSTLGISPGGSVALDLDELAIGLNGPPPTRDGCASQPAAAPTSAVAVTGTTPASAPALPQWRWAGNILLKDAMLELGVSGQKFTGQVEGSMSGGGEVGRLAIAADVSMDSFTIGNARLEKFEGKLAKRADSDLLKLAEFSGQAFGGSIAGKAAVRLAGATRYELDLSVDNVDLKEFLVATRSPSPGRAAVGPAGPFDAQGVMTGCLQLTGTAGDNDSRRGAGKVHIERAKLRQLPVMLGFLNVLNLSVPNEATMTSAELEYLLRGHVLSLREMYLQSPSVCMVGSGTVDTKTEKLNLLFLSGPPRKLPRLSALERALERISSELMAVKVTGSVAKPRVQTSSFHSLEDPLRDIMNPEQ